MFMYMFICYALIYPCFHRDCVMYSDHPGHIFTLREKLGAGWHLI